MKMADKADLSILFSHLPEFTLNKETFFRDAVESLWDEKDLSNYTSAIQGLFSGSVMQYFLSNRAAFDDADAHGGLLLYSRISVCRWIRWTKCGKHFRIIRI